MLWDATYAEGNINQGMTYCQTMKEILAKASRNTLQSCTQKVLGPLSTKTSVVSSMTSSTRTASSKIAIHLTEASTLTTRKAPLTCAGPAATIPSPSYSTANVLSGIGTDDTCGKMHTCKGNRYGLCYSHLWYRKRVEWQRMPACIWDVLF